MRIQCQGSQNISLSKVQAKRACQAYQNTIINKCMKCQLLACFKEARVTQISTNEGAVLFDSNITFCPYCGAKINFKQS